MSKFADDFRQSFKKYHRGLGYVLPTMLFGAFGTMVGMFGALSGVTSGMDGEGAKGEDFSLTEEQRYEQRIEEIDRTEEELRKIDNFLQAVHEMKISESTDLGLRGKVDSVKIRAEQLREGFNFAVQDITYKIVTNPNLNEGAAFNLGSKLASKVDGKLPPWFADSNDRLSFNANGLQECQIKYAQIDRVDQPAMISACSGDIPLNDAIKSLGGGALGGISVLFGLPLIGAAGGSLRRWRDNKNANVTISRVRTKREP